MGPNHPAEIQRQILRTTIAQEMDHYPELRRDALMRRLVESLDATTTLTAVYQGKFSDEMVVPDNAERRAALRMAMELRNEFPAKQVDIRSAVRVEELHTIALQLEQQLPIEQLMRIVDGHAPPALLEAETIEAPRD